jgi:spectinomycin phosphotransferase
LRALPDDFDVATLIEALRTGWDVDVETAEYAPVGGGSYHWVVTARDGTRQFVTVDDLDRKPWLGDSRESACTGLAAAFDTAAALREGGLEFVLAPVRARGGETLLRADPRHAVSLFPFVAGEAGTFGQYDDAERAAIEAMLTALHDAKAPTARVMDLELPGRSELDAALRELDGPWDGGPLSEAARRALKEQAAAASDLLTRYDRLAATLPGLSDWVVTHGEPHAANVIRAGGRYVLVDWDTVALAPAARDRWMLVDDSDATAFFRLRWDLADLAAFTTLLRSPHSENADTRKALDGVTIVLGRP